MKTNLITTFCFFIFCCAYSQELKKEYHDNGNVKLEYLEVNDKPDGIVKIYYETGELQGKLNYSGGLQNGPSLIYYPSGALMKEITYLDGFQVDTMKIYHENGQLGEVSIIKDGKKEGYFVQYHENGNLWIKGSTKSGMAHGKFEQYKEDGTLEERGEYHFGKKVGNWLEQDEIGVTYKQYKSAKEPIQEDSVTSVAFDAETFALTHSSSWRVQPHPNPVVKFVGVYAAAEGLFKKNITVLRQPMEEGMETLDELIERANAALLLNHPTYEVLSDEEGQTTAYTYRDVQGTWTQDLTISVVYLKFWTRYFIVGENNYQITYISEIKDFDTHLAEATALFDSFQLK